VSTPLSNSSRPRILLAEDNEVNQKVALRMLEKLGYDADLVANGIDVLKALEREAYDLILMDLHMPMMSGIEAAVEIRKRAIVKQPVIVALTASATSSDRDRCLRAGMDDYLSKPIQIDQLREKIRTFTTEPVRAEQPGDGP
jgi:CheY-like chemotaxis protein